MTHFAQQTVAAFSEHVAAATPAPAGGSVAAATCALGAGLVALAARVTLHHNHVPRVTEILTRAEALRHAALALIDRDVEAYGAVVAAQRTGDPKLIDAARSDAADPPLQIALIAAEIAERGAELVCEGAPVVRADAQMAVTLAHAAAQGASALVAVNLATAPDDARSGQARAAAQRAGAALVSTNPS